MDATLRDTDPLVDDGLPQSACSALRLDLRAILVGSHRIGLSSRLLCQDAGVPPLHTLQRPQDVQAAIARLWREILSERPDPLTPLWIGAAVPFGFHPLLDHLGAADEPLPQALARICDDYRRVCPELQLQLGERELRLESTPGPPEQRKISLSYTTGVILSRLQAVLGAPLALERLELVAAEGSEHAQRLAAWLGASASFGYAHTRIVFRRASWEQRLHALGPALAQLRCGSADEPQPEADTLTKIRETLDAERTTIPPTLEHVAQKLGMTERTFQRRLHECGVTYRQLLAEQQRERATRLLAQRKLPISQVAFALGYSEQAAFARAFRRWTGQTPRTYRRNSVA